MTATTAPVRDVAAPSGRRVFTANVRAEWTKLRSVRSTTWTLLATVGIAVGFGALVGVSQMSSWDNLDPGEQLRFDPTFFSLSGLWLAQLAVGVLGVLLVTSEYATGQIRATLGATPQRTIVVAAKATAFTGVVLAAGLLSSFAAFIVGQAIFDTKGLGVSITEPGVIRAVAGGGLYVAAVGLLGLGLGTILRRTAGAVAALVGVLVLAPLVSGFLPSSFQESIGKLFPAQAGMAIFSVTPDPRSLSPWAGYGVLLAYVAVTLAVGVVLLHPTRRLKGQPMTPTDITASPKKPPAWFVHTAWRVHRSLHKLSGGRFLWTTTNKRGWGAMRLTAIGRRSGEPRSVIVGYIEDGPNLVTLAMNGWDEGHPAWWHNLQAQPDATVQLAGQHPRRVRARAAVGSERDRLWERWVEVDPDLTAHAPQRHTDTPVVVFEALE